MTTSEQLSTRQTIPGTDDLLTHSPKVPIPKATAESLKRALENSLSRKAISTKASRILIVDDEISNLQVVCKYLQDAGFTQCVVESSPVRILDQLLTDAPDLMLLDIVMPGISGIDILHAMSQHEQLQHIPVIALTDRTDLKLKQVCLELGAADFLAKPVDPTDLLPRVRNMLLQKQYRDQVARHAEVLEQQVRQRTAELVASREEVVRCLARAGEFRDDDTGHHVMRVGKYVGVIARRLGFPQSRVEVLELAAQLHDIGKIGVPDQILHKPGRLDDTEFNVMRRHCGIGKQIIQPLDKDERTTLRSHTRLGASMLHVPSSPLLMLAARIAQTHHERYDGTGYPLGLQGDDIPIEGRMTTVADVYDALSTKRSYKPAFPREKCFRILEEGRGTHFDPHVLDAFFASAEEIIQVQLDFMDT